MPAGHPTHVRSPLSRAGRRRRGALLTPVAMAVLLHAGSAGAAAFLPGDVEADPPTGPTGPGLQLAARAEEPLAGDGILWALAPWLYRGTVTLDARALKLEDGRRTRLGLLLGDLEFASYVWQPWFIQLRAGVGVVLGRDSNSGGDAPPSRNGSNALTGRVQVSVFPASRFPFELRADVGDSRASGETLVNDYRTVRVSLSQSWRPQTGNDLYALNLDHSRVRGGDGVSDTLTLLRASGVRQWGRHTLDVGLSVSTNTRTDNDDSSRQTSFTARHAWTPATTLTADTLASWSDVRLGIGRGSSRLSLASDIRQLSTFASWQPRPGDWGWSESGALVVTATARVIDSGSSSEGNGGGDGARLRARGYNLSFGVGKDLGRTLRLSSAFSYSRLEAAAGVGSTLMAVTGTLAWTPDTLALGEWRYAPSGSLNLGWNDAPDGQRRQTVGVQGAHALSRTWMPAEGHSLAFNVAQSVGTLREMPGGLTSTGIAHSAGLFWQSAGAGSSQSFASLSVSDSRTKSQGTGSFQFLNLQISRRTQLSRYDSWSANLTAQATRSSAELLDAFDGLMRLQSDGWQRYYSGSLTYESQRVFGVPRLRFTAALTVNSQQFERRALGDIDAPLERVSESAEARLDYGIGRLETRLSARVARVDGRAVAALVARAQRRF